MNSSDRRLNRAQWVAVASSIILTAIAVGATLEMGPPDLSTPSLRSADLSSSLAGVFHPGVILGAGSNQTDTLLAGIGVYARSPEYSLPVLADLRAGPNGPSVSNLTPAAEPYFFEGGTYALGWNGSDWLVGGQATWGGVNAGTLVSLRGETFTNLTPLIGPYFSGGGIYALGWNGTAWLLGGNSSTGIAVVAVHGNQVVNLTGLVPGRDPFGWVQLIAWNGAEWLLGGQEVFGTLAGGTYHDLLPSSPFVGSGVYSGAWNGSAWLAGGGGGDLAVVRNDATRPAPLLPVRFDQAVLVIASYSAGWLIGGKGSTTAGGFAPALVTWDGATGSSGIVDLGALIPATFQGGELQGGGWAPAFGPGEFVVVGEGNYNTASGYGVGAMALLTIP